MVEKKEMVAADKEALAAKAAPKTDKSGSKAPAAKAAAASEDAATGKAASKPAASKSRAKKTASAQTSTAAKKTSAAKAGGASATANKTAARKTASATKASAAAKPEKAKAPVAEKREAGKAAPEPKKASAKTATAKAEVQKKADEEKAAVEKKAAAEKAAAEKKAAEEKAAAEKKAAEEKAAAEKAASEKAAAEKKAAEEKAAAEKAAAEKKAAEEKAAAEKAAAEKAAAEKAAAEKKAAEEKAAAEKAAAEKKAAEEKAAAEQKAKAESAAAALAEEAAKIVEDEKAEGFEFSDIPGVLIAAAECAPLVKVGGMADVVGALPKYLKKLGVDARVIMPFHRQIKERFGAQAEHLADFQASLGWRSQYVGLERLELDGVVYYFIDNEFYFGGPIYCGGEFEGEQYAFFTRAVMDSIPLLDFDVRILHCNDWHTAMMPLLVKTQYQGGMQAGLRTVLTIHNLHFQGQFSHEFDRDLLRVDDSLATPQFIEHYGCDNMLKAGIVFADKVNTVSPTYAREICEPYQGESLDGVLRTRGGDLWGILNGIDTDIWNPQTDENLPAHYSVKSLSRKRKVRDALLEELGLEPAGDQTAVIAMVGRLTPQKGIDLVRFVLDELMREDVRVIVLGSGYTEYEDFLRNAEYRHKGRLCSYIGYNADLSHRIYAGSDLFLMPSLFEPCGISQMISMAYGTLPIVHETGGLKDTVMPYNEYTGEGNGFSFANYDAGEMLDMIRYALWIWRNEDARKALMTHAMESDFSFDRCARGYAELYRSLL